MSDPVLITMIVCITIFAILLMMAIIQVLEKHSDKDKKKKEWPNDLPPM